MVQYTPIELRARPPPEHANGSRRTLISFPGKGICVPECLDAPIVLDLALHKAICISTFCRFLQLFVHIAPPPNFYPYSIQVYGAGLPAATAEAAQIHNCTGR